MKNHSIICALQNPAAYPHPVADIRLFETHISWVLLTGEFVYKIKKPVDFGFLDFSTLEKRHFYCEEELRLNRRLAPQLYLAVVPVTGSPEMPRLGGSGTPLEYAVKMRQFDPRQTFDELLERGALSVSLMEQTAGTLAEFHQRIAVSTPNDDFGTPDAIWNPVNENFIQVDQCINSQSFMAAIRETSHHLHQWSQTQHEKLRAVFAQRKKDGFVRECHGDLHLRNIVLWHDQVVPFDGIEFSPQLRWIDVMSELAFLLMDLDDHQQQTLSRPLLNRYLSLCGDYGGLATLRYYQVYRAMVRAKVAGLRLSQLDDASKIAQNQQQIHNYIHLADKYTRPDRVRLIITHGLSGSGKSYLSRELARHFDVIHLRSDVERKRLFGLSELTHSESGLNTGIYANDATRATYQRLYTLADICLHSGFSVLVDATFLQYEQRTRFFSLAQQLACPFVILDCQADENILRQRVKQREQQGTDASEANLRVLEKQLTEQQPLTDEENKYALHIDTVEEIDVAVLAHRLNNIQQ